MKLAHLPTAKSAGLFDIIENPIGVRSKSRAIKNKEDSALPKHSSTNQRGFKKQEHLVYAACMIC